MIRANGVSRPLLVVFVQNARRIGGGIRMNRAIEILDGATPEAYKEGIAWYPNANRICQELSDETGNSLDMVIKVVAATSPRCTWSGNIAKARKHLTNRICSDLPCVMGNLDRILHNQELSGHKVRAFANAIAGDESAVPVDMWMIRAFGAKEGSKSYPHIVGTILETAQMVSLAPREVQAVIWCQLRGKAN